VLRTSATTSADSLRGVDAAIEISTDRARIDRDLVHRFLSEHSYWALGRTREENDRVMDASLPFGAYLAGRQVAYARVLTDSVAFAYLGDVFVLPEARGRGVGKALMEAILAHPAIGRVRRLALVTDDAHGLYEQYGFRPLDDVRKWMQRRP
jgi:GNAT superfamily N-acetyltransferase